MAASSHLDGSILCLFWDFNGQRPKSGTWLIKSPLLTFSTYLSPPTSAQDLFQKMCHKCLSRKGRTAEQGLCWLRTLRGSTSIFPGELKVTNMPSSPMDLWPWGFGKTESLISSPPPPAESTISIIDLEGMLIGMKWLVVEAKYENEAKTIRNGKQK